MRLKELKNGAGKFARLTLGVRSRVPREIQLEVTNRCNLDCDMCPRLSLLNVPEIDMSRDTFEAVLARLRAPTSITLTGWGEPLMHPELFAFIDAIAERFPRADVGFTTNGHLLSDGVIQDVLSRPISRVNVSLEELPWTSDGPRDTPEPPLPVDHRTGDPLKGGINHVARDGHPTPPKVVRRLEAFLSARNARAARGQHAPEVRLQVVLFPGGEQTTLRLVEFAADLGFQAINLVRMDVRGRSDLVRPSWTEERRMISLSRARADQRGVPLGSVNDHGAILRTASKSDRFCVRLDDYIYVDVEGNVAPCCLLRDHRLGNLTRQSLEEIWRSPAFKRFYGPGLHPACVGCNAFMNGYAEAGRTLATVTR